MRGNELAQYTLFIGVFRLSVGHSDLLALGSKLSSLEESKLSPFLFLSVLTNLCML